MRSPAEIRMRMENARLHEQALLFLFLDAANQRMALGKRIEQKLERLPKPPALPLFDEEAAWRMLSDACTKMREDPHPWLPERLRALVWLLDDDARFNWQSKRIVRDIEEHFYIVDK